MKASFIFLILIIGLCNASFINPYPRYEYRSIDESDDVGEPLILTPFIESGQIETAQKLARVTNLTTLDIESYSGYFTVNKTFNSNMFFWYFPAANEPENAPVVLWLQGGPGASSLFGLFTENGPFSVAKDMELQPRKYTWHLSHHMIYIDNPVGTGFSYTDEGGYSKNEHDVGKNLYTALLQFFQMFPKLQDHKFFVTGESYAGKYVPAVCHCIHKMNPNAKQKINLHGLAIGNGLSDPLHQLKYGDYLYQLGLIDSKGRDTFHKYEKMGEHYIKAKKFEEAFKIFDILINMDELPSGSLFKNMTGFETYFNYLHTKGDDSDKYMGDFLQKAATRKAIHVGNNSFHDLEGENKVEEHLMLDVMDTVAPFVSEILSHYRTVIYNGQMDIIVAYPLTVNYLRNLGFPDHSKYMNAPRYIWKVDGEIAGYAKEAGNLVEVMVRNAGHMVPHDQPKWALDMIMRLTHGKAFH